MGPEKDGYQVARRPHSPECGPDKGQTRLRPAHQRPRQDAGTTGAQAGLCASPELYSPIRETVAGRMTGWKYQNRDTIDRVESMGRVMLQDEGVLQHSR